MVFSSSCTVYGDVPPEEVPIKETNKLGASSPYGRSKLIIENMFQDVAKSDKDWRIVLLRYFNPVGAHPTGAHLWPPPKADHLSSHSRWQHRLVSTLHCMAPCQVPPSLAHVISDPVPML